MNCGHFQNVPVKTAATSTAAAAGLYAGNK